MRTFRGFLMVALAAIVMTFPAMPAEALDMEGLYADCQSRNPETGRWEYVWPCENGSRLTVTACVIPNFIGEGGGVAVTVYDPEDGYELTWRKKPATMLLFDMGGDCKRVLRTRSVYVQEGNFDDRNPYSRISVPIAGIVFSAKGGEEGQPEITYVSWERGCRHGADEFGRCQKPIIIPLPDGDGGGGGGPGKG